MQPSGIQSFQKVDFMKHPKSAGKEPMVIFSAGLYACPLRIIEVKSEEKTGSQIHQRVSDRSPYFCNVSPLKEATKYVDSLLPSICIEQDSSVKEWNDYDIKVAFAKVAMRNI